jgi:hypothetical protein
MPDLLKRLGKLRDDVRRSAAEYMAERSAAVAVSYIDRSRMIGKKLLVVDLPSMKHRPQLDLSISFHAQWQIREIVLESYTKMERSPLDLECSVVAIPFRWRKTEVTLLLFYDNSPGNSYLRSFKRHVRPIEFSYWNNTDTPDEISDSEWDDRGRIWDAAIGSDPPAERGFTFDCMTQHHVPLISDEQIAKHLKTITFKKRLDAIAEEFIEDRRYRLMKNRKKDVQISDIWKWKRTPAGKLAFKKARAVAQKRLPRKITMSMLRAPMSTIARH